MKNFLIIVFALGFAAAAFLTRPDREEFEQFVHERHRRSTEGSGILKRFAFPPTVDDLEYQDFYLWTVVRKDGKTLYTGIFDHWIDNEKVRQSLPS